MAEPILLSSRRRKERRARVIKIVSGQGGVGKSLISAYLANMCADAGLFCLLYDGDHSMGLLDQYCNSILSKGSLPKGPDRKISDVIAGTASLDDTIERAYGFDLIPSQYGNIHLSELAPSEIGLLESKLEKMLPHYDVTIIDSRPGLGKSSFMYARLADELVCMSTPDRIGLTAGYAAAKVASFIYEKSNMKWLLNKSYGEQAIDFSSGVFRNAGLDIESLGSLPFIESLSKGVHALPLYSPFLRQLEIVADQLCKIQQER